MGGTRESLGYINIHFTDFFVTYFHTFIWIFYWATRIPENALHLLLHSLTNSSFYSTALHTNSILNYFLLIYQGYVLKYFNQLDHRGLSEMYFNSTSAPYRLQRRLHVPRGTESVLCMYFAGIRLTGHTFSVLLYLVTVQ